MLPSMTQFFLYKKAHISDVSPVWQPLPFPMYSIRKLFRCQSDNVVLIHRSSRNIVQHKLLPSVCSRTTPHLCFYFAACWAWRRSRTYIFSLIQSLLYGWYVWVSALYLYKHVIVIFTGSNQHFNARLICIQIDRYWPTKSDKSYLHKTAQICQIVNKVKQLTNVISDGGTVWIHPLEMLFIHFANTWKRGAGHAEWK